MPELPEVETVRRGLDNLIVGRQVESIDFNWPKGFPNSKTDVDRFLIGSNIVAVRRRAKVLIVDLDTDYSLVVHLKMTGQMVYVGEQKFGAGHPSDSLINKLPDKSTRVTIKFTDNSNLYFNDQRKFGWMKLYPTRLLNDVIVGFAPESSARQKRVADRAVFKYGEGSSTESNAAEAQDHLQKPELASIYDKWGADSTIDFLRKVGPEPLEPDFTHQVFVDRIKKRKNTSVKAAILDQTVLAGVGNIYADEALWGAKIHPASRVIEVSENKLKTLHKEIIFVLNLSIEKGGSTDRNYVNAEGKKGSYIEFARVFRRENQDCPRHPGTKIVKIRVAGRGTHICPKCQKL